MLRFRCGSQNCSQDSSSLHTKPPAPLPGAVASPVHPSGILAHPSAAPATHWDAPGAPSRLCWGLRWVPALRSAGMGAWGPAQQTAPRLTAGRLLSKTCLRDSNEPETGTREEKRSPGAGAEPPPRLQQCAPGGPGAARTDGRGGDAAGILAGIAGGISAGISAGICRRAPALRWSNADTPRVAEGREPHAASLPSPRAVSAPSVAAFSKSFQLASVVCGVCFPEYHSKNSRC